MTTSNIKKVSNAIKDIMDEMDIDYDKRKINKKRRGMMRGVNHVKYSFCMLEPTSDFNAVVHFNDQRADKTIEDILVPMGDAKDRMYQEFAKRLDKKVGISDLVKQRLGLDYDKQDIVDM